MSKLDDYLEQEEHFFYQDKQKKTKKKSLSNSHKETFFSKKKEEAEGRILHIAPDAIEVYIAQKTISCVLKGALKQKRGKNKNIAVVGDWVKVKMATENSGVITQVQPRHSLLSRRDSFSRRKQQLIAANIDQVLITMSVIAPRFTPLLVDRYVIAARKGNMEPIVVINKSDLFSSSLIKATADERKQEKLLVEEFRKVYHSLSIPIYYVSCTTGENLDHLKAAMKGKTSVFSGQSGVGKSSLINAMTKANCPVGELIEKNRKGSHTTTAAKLILLDGGGFCIDTPGIKSFSLWDLQIEEIRTFFPDFIPFTDHCRFANCTHRKEPNCGVKMAVERGELSSLRYNSYLALMDDPEPKEWE